MDDDRSTMGGADDAAIEQRFAAAVPLAAGVVVVLVACVGWNAARLGPALPPAAIAAHVALVALAIHVVRVRCQRQVAALQAAERRAASERLSATARLAGGLAHDFNNLMCVIAINAELLDDPALPAADRALVCAEVRDASARGTAIARQLMAFGRRQEVRRTAVCAAAEVQQLEHMLARAVGPTVAVEIAAASTAAVAVDRDQLGQVLLNLAVNARDAMPSGGALAISVRDSPIEAPVRARHPSAAPGPHVAIAVRDTGTGMDPATAARAFDPYFTTKPDGRGTGLGLSMVHGIVHQHGGVVDLETAPGRGTCVTLYLPMASLALAG